MTAQLLAVLAAVGASPAPQGYLPQRRVDPEVPAPAAAEAAGIDCPEVCSTVAALHRLRGSNLCPEGCTGESPSRAADAGAPEAEPGEQSPSLLRSGGSLGTAVAHAVRMLGARSTAAREAFGLIEPGPALRHDGMERGLAT